MMTKPQRDELRRVWSEVESIRQQVGLLQERPLYADESIVDRVKVEDELMSQLNRKRREFAHAIHAALPSLLDAFEAAEVDTARLDWLISRGCHFTPGLNFYAEPDSTDRVTHFKPGTAREAIDAARKAVAP